MYKVSKEEYDEIVYMFNLKRQKEKGDLDLLVKLFRAYVSKGYPICLTCPSSVSKIKSLYDEWYRHKFKSNYEIIELNTCKTCNKEIEEGKSYCDKECFYNRNK